MNKRDVIVNGALGAAVIGLGVGTWLAVGSPARASAGAGARTATVSTGSVTAAVAANGNLASATDTTVGATDCTGKITTLPAQLGQKVKAGDLLATIDRTTAQQALAAAQANLASAQSSLQASIANARASLDAANASASLDKQQTDTNLATTKAAIAADKLAVAAARDQQTLNQATSQLAKDNAQLVQQEQQAASSTLKDDQQVASAQRQLDQATSGSGGNGSSNLTTAEQNVSNAQKALEDCSIKAPTAGTITAVNATLGGNASGSSGNGSSSSSSSASSGLFVISDVSSMKVTSAFSEADVASIKAGQSATITFPAITDSTHPAGISTTGKVTQISPTSTVSSGVVTYSVTIVIPNPPAGVRLGQTANVTVTTASRENVLRVPTNAVTTAGAVKTVELRTGTTTRATPVETGISGDGFTEIVSGLQDRDVVQLPTQTNGSTTGTFGGRGVGGIATVGGR